MCVVGISGLGWQWMTEFLRVLLLRRQSRLPPNNAVLLRLWRSSNKCEQPEPLRPQQTERTTNPQLIPAQHLVAVSGGAKTLPQTSPAPTEPPSAAGSIHNQTNPASPVPARRPDHRPPMGPASGPAGPRVCTVGPASGPGDPRAGPFGTGLRQHASKGASRPPSGRLRDRACRGGWTRRANPTEPAEDVCPHRRLTRGSQSPDTTDVLRRATAPGAAIRKGPHRRRQSTLRR